MKEITKSFSDKAIRNAIGAFLLIIFLIYSSFAKNKTIAPFHFALLIIPVLWLFIGLNLRRKFKTFPDNPDYNNRFLVQWSRTTDRIFYLLLVLAFILRTRKMYMPDFLLISIFILYTIWLVYKWNEISKVFKQI